MANQKTNVQILDDALAAILEAEKAEEQLAAESVKASLEILDGAVAKSNEQIEAEDGDPAINKLLPKNKRKALPSGKNAPRSMHEQNQRLKRMTIKRELVKADNILFLQEFIPSSLKRKVIPFMTKALVESITDLKANINRRIAIVMAPLFPEKLRVARALCGTLPFKDHPGFLWIGDEAYGGHKIWVNPDIPYYFDQFSEMAIIRSKCDENKVAAIDRIIANYMNAVTQLAKRESNIAIKLTRIDTFEELLTYNVDCFLYIYELYKAEKLEEARIMREEQQEELAKRIESGLLDIEAIEQEMLKKHKKDEEDSKGFATDKK